MSSGAAALSSSASEALAASATAYMPDTTSTLDSSSSKVSVVTVRASSRCGMMRRSSSVITPRRPTLTCTAMLTAFLSLLNITS